MEEEGAVVVEVSAVAVVLVVALARVAALGRVAGSEEDLEVAEALVEGSLEEHIKADRSYVAWPS